MKGRVHAVGVDLKRNRSRSRPVQAERAGLLLQALCSSTRLQEMQVRVLLAFVVALCLAGIVQGSTWYISPSGNDTNSGSSQAPFLSLSAALDACSEGDTISVANGVYTGSDNIGLSFTTNVTVVGESLSAVFQANLTTGAIFNAKAEVHFSTMTIVGLPNPGAMIGIFVSTYFDGGSVENVAFASLEQGIYYSSFWSRASVSNCTFQSSVGTGIYANTPTAVSVGLTVDGSLFQSEGGLYINPAVYGDWEFLTVSDCSFENSNLVMLYSNTPTESVTIENCDFVGFTSDGLDSPIDLHGLYPTVTMTSVTVTQTQTTRCSTVYVAASASDFFGDIILTDCWFSYNDAGTYTSGLWSYGYNLSVKECGFVGNIGQAFWADPYNNNPLSVSIEDSVFFANDARSSSLAIISLTNFAGDASVTDSFFVGNKGSVGAGIAVSNMELDVTGCYFIDNESSGDGGAIYVSASANVTVANSMLMKNTAWSGGAVAAESDAGVTFSRTILAGNNAADNGGAIYLKSDSLLTISSCLIMNNYAPNGGGWFLDDSSATGEYLIIRRNNATLSGGGFACDGTGTTDISSALLLGNYAPTGSAYSCTGGCQTTLSGGYVAPNNSGSGCTSDVSIVDEAAEQLGAAEMEAELEAALPEFDMDSLLARIEARIGAL